MMVVLVVFDVDLFLVPMFGSSASVVRRVPREPTLLCLSSVVQGLAL